MKLTVVLNADASGLVGTLRVGEAELRKLGGQLDRTAGSSAKTGEQFRRAGAEAKSFDNSAAGLARTLNTVSGVMATLGVTYVATQLIQAGRAMDRFTVSLSAAAGSQQQGAREMAFLRSEAERLGLYLPTLIQGYTGLTAATRGTALEGEATRKIFSAVAEAGRAMNLTNDQIMGTMNALQQMAGKGTVSMEELRQQLGDRLPGAMQVAARAMNMTVAELVKMVSEGKLASEEFLPRFAEELSKSSAAGVEFARNSPEAVFNRMKTALFELAAAISGAGLLELLADIAGGVTTMADALATRVPGMVDIWRDTLGGGFHEVIEQMGLDWDAFLGATGDASTSLLGRIVEEFMILPVTLGTIITILIGEFDKLWISTSAIFRKLVLSGEDSWLALQQSLAPVAGEIKLIFARVIDDILGRLASLVASAATVADRVGAGDTAAKLNSLAGSIKGVAVAEEAVRAQIAETTAELERRRAAIKVQTAAIEQDARTRRAIADEAIQASLDERDAALDKLRANKAAADQQAAVTKLMRQAVQDSEAQAKAQEKLTRATNQWESLLGRVAGAMDPVTKAQEQHNKFVRDATTLAETLIKLGADEVDIRNQLNAAIAQSAQNRDDEIAKLRETQRAHLQVLSDLDQEAALIGMSTQARDQHLASLRAEEVMRRAIHAAQQAGAEFREAEIEHLVELASARAAANVAMQQTKDAWEDFTGGLADAILDGSKGVKRWWKAMLDDMKRQLIQSGLLKIFGSIFNIGGAQAGSGFGSMFASMFGGGRGMIGSAASGGSGLGIGSLVGSGGSLFSGLATAISGGISTGLMSLGGTLAGLGMGGLGGGLAWAGGSVAANGLLGGLGGSFMTGMGNLFGAGGGALMGIGQMIPAIAAIAGVAAAIQKISGGKLFGTSYGFDSAGRTLDFSATGASGQDRVTEVRQRSLFRGRRWRDTFSDLPDDVADSIGEFWDAVTASNIAIAGDAARTIGAQIKQEFDKDGNVTSTIVEVIGRQYRESLEEAMTRIAAENTIANIDALLGTTVQGTGPGFGGNGPGFGGGGGFDRGGFDAVMEGIGYTVEKTTQTVGEAFAIAERWRHDAELLAAGAQFLLAAATDIRRGAGLLGDEGGLTAIADLIEDLATAGESLVDTYVRVATSAALLDQALALSGVQIDGTREHIVRLATAITDAAGGLERATALWNSYFSNFYSAAELAAFQSQQLRTAAEAAFSAAGLNLDDYTHDLAAFRAAFEAALPTLSAEEIANWLAAADALAAVTATARAIDAAIADGAWQQYLDGLTDSQRAIAETTKYYDDWRDSLIASGATAEQLAAVEEQRAIAMGRVIAANAEAAAQEQARLEDAGRRYADFITGIWRETVQLSDYQAAMMDADDWRTRAIATAHEHARAAGMAGASEQALALIELRASQLRAQALAQLREETQSLVDQLYGARGNDIGTAFTAGMESASNAAADYWEQQRRSAETLQQYLDSMLLGDLSALTPAEQLAEAWSQLNDAVAGGDADAATRLADAYLRLLRGHEASGEDYNAGFWSVRELLQGMLDNIGPIPDEAPGGAGGSGYITAAGAEQIAAQNRLDLAVQLAQHLADLAGAVGQTVWELMDSMGVDLRQLTADLGISLQTITGETVLALVNMADLLGTDLLTLTGQLSVSLTDMGAGIRELATQTGVNLDALTVESVQALGGLANQLGIDLADIATSVGADLGSLADSQSLLNQALQGEIDKLPDDQARALQEYFDNIVAATSEADANEAINTMAGYINSLDADIRDALAPYFADVFPAKALTDLDYLTSINRQTADMATAMITANGLLARIADNAMAANNAAGIPSYAVGTYNVPATGPAILHAGEMVLPRPMADAMRQGNFGGGGDTRALETRLDAVIARLDRLDKTTAQGAQAVSQTIVTTGATSDRNNDASRARHAQAQRRGVTA